MIKNGWGLDLEFPLLDRRPKPRNIGLTMVLDKGLGLGETRDLLEIAGEYIDFLKLSFGTSALYSPYVLHKKIELVRSYGIDIYPGGTFLEVAILQGKLDQFLERARELGFSCIEVSDGTIEMDYEMRKRAIQKAVDLGFKVLTEIGKKDKNEVFQVDEMVKLLNKDLENGAYRVIVEGRESGTVGIYDSKGDADQNILEKLLYGAPSSEVIIWEAPLKKQQVHLIKTLGNNVNLGNIPTSDILAVEALRNGLRGDTFKEALYRYQNPVFYT
ncbi:phosphosulfolactate synthase [Anoxybacter fermentans]|uniref:Phosphosulfolactate synthase n=1 Tax=Anoxybacter fermentans TaxID=1323375 RepID=A0A3Q9HU48_9FIRM|nr:phosphosulfolactate synthase [Anoxybacter fermentans]AZR74394.1 phosphosulfolactate synthase [Anoxybacter fermentans]